jgi:GAF domain-containing protein
MIDQSRTENPPTESFAAPAEDGAALAAAAGDDELPRVTARLAEVERERDHLVAIVELLQEIATAEHFVDVLQTIARRLGDAFALDRCAIFLTGENDEIRLVASYEDPSIRNLVVDINRYPELKRVFETGETVFIPDATSDPMLKAVRAQLEQRNVRSVVVVPLQADPNIIGALFLRTTRDGQPFSHADVRFCQTVASLAVKALRNAHRVEALLRKEQNVTAGQRRAELQRIALIAFLRRLLDRHAEAADQSWAETLLPKASDEELERLVAVAMHVFEEEAKG